MDAYWNSDDLIKAGVELQTFLDMTNDDIESISTWRNHAGILQTECGLTLPEWLEMTEKERRVNVMQAENITRLKAEGKWA